MPEMTFPFGAAYQHADNVGSERPAKQPELVLQHDSRVVLLQEQHQVEKRQTIPHDQGSMKQQRTLIKSAAAT